MKLIPLTQGKFAKVDDNDYEKLVCYKWNAHKNYKNTFYATRTKKKIYMHRVILGLKKGDKVIVDHINGDGLDNCKENLKATTHRINHQNRAIHRKGNLAGARRKPNGKYEARILINGVSRYLGVFNTEQKAHEVYKNASVA